MLIKRIVDVKLSDEWDDEKEEYGERIERQTQYSVGIGYAYMGRKYLSHAEKRMAETAKYYFAKDGEWVEWEGGKEALEEKAYGVRGDYHDLGRTLIRSKGNVGSDTFRLFRWMRNDTWQTLDRIKQQLLGNYNEYSNAIGKLNGLAKYNRLGMRMLTCNNSRDMYDCYGISHLNHMTTSDQQYNKRNNAFIPNYSVFAYLGEKVLEDWEAEKNAIEDRNRERLNLTTVMDAIPQLESEKQNHENYTERILDCREQFADLKITVIKSLLMNQTMKPEFIDMLCVESEEYSGEYLSDVGRLSLPNATGENNYKQSKKALASSSLQDIARGVGNIDRLKTEWSAYSDSNEVITEEQIAQAVSFVETAPDKVITDLRECVWEHREKPAVARQDILDRIVDDMSAYETAFTETITAKETRKLSCEIVKAEYKAAVLSLVSQLTR